jgi:hypothetical protein
MAADSNMRSILLIVLFLILAPASTFGQERITKIMGGRSGDQFRVLVTFIDPGEEVFKTQSLIIDVNPVKKSEQPTSFYVDLTTTTRSMETGAKKQKILVMRWGRSGDIEVKCEGGKWGKQAAVPETDRIVDTVKAVIQNSPLDAVEAREFNLSTEIQQKVSSVLSSLETSNLTCVRGN